MNNKRQRIAKQRTLRQSKVDLATELGLHSQGGPDDQAATSGLVANKQEAPSFFALGTNGPVSERRQRQLEKIRAMAAELKPERTTTNATGKRGAKGGKTKAVRLLIGYNRNVSRVQTFPRWGPSHCPF